MQGTIVPRQICTRRKLDVKEVRIKIPSIEKSADSPESPEFEKKHVYGAGKLMESSYDRKSRK
jgi:hypothetical protein